MKQFVPTYYNQFKCIAGSCKHTCCAGWEIDIDRFTLDSWNNMSEPHKSFICDNICMPADTKSEEKPYLKMKANQDCHFLRDDGLCEMILKCGEDSLCQICTDHPRFRNFFSDRIEMGVGLSCEAAADLIINYQGDFKLKETKEKLHPACQADADETIEEVSSMSKDELLMLRQNESDIFELRNILFSMLHNQENDIFKRLDDILDFCDIQLPELTISQLSEEFLSLEQLSSEWTSLLKKLKNIGEYPLDTLNMSNLSCKEEGAWQKAYENLAVYFIYRHLPESLTDYDVLTKISFSVLSVKLLHAICVLHVSEHGNVQLSDLSNYARMYSSEVEYSLSNLGKIYDFLF